MKTNFKRWALAALVATSGLATASTVRAGGSVGDLPGYGEDTYFAEDAAYAQPQTAAPAASPPTQASSQMVDPHVGPAVSVGSGHAAAALQPVGFFSGGGCGDASCDGGCDAGCGAEMTMGCDMGGCDMGSCNMSGCDALPGGCSLGGCNPCAPQTWATFEALLWFIENRDVPALVAASPAGTLPVQGNAGYDVLFGDEIDSGLAAGFRIDGGRYITDNLGFGGRYWRLFDGAEEETFEGNGSDRSLGRPFFNTDQAIEDALLIALDGVFEGAAEVESEIDMWAAEAYGRLRFSGTRDHSLELIGGYTHMNVEDYLRVDSVTVNSTPTPGNPAGTIRGYRDVFETENEFNGGQIGFEAVLTRGRWMARSLTKVHLGNMSQTVRIDGESVREQPGFAATNTDGGFLALGNQGTATRDEFAFIPEANFKLAYRMRPNAMLSVGYSFLYIDSVALAGDLIDRDIDPTVLNSGGPFGTRPAFDFNDSSLYVHGVDIGMVLSF